MGSSPSKPEFVTVLADKEVKLGKDVILSCEVNTEKLTVSWEKNGTTLKCVQGKHIVRKTGTSHLLEIKNAEEDDEGTYTITLTNTSGSEFCNATVTVELKEWRTVQWKQDQSVNTLNDSKISNKEINELRFLLYGLIGSGKSSIINTIETIFERCVSMQDTASFHSHTLKLEKHTFKNAQDGGSLPLIFIDVMGVEIGEHNGVLSEDIISALKGHIKEGYQFNPHTPITENSQDYLRNRSIHDRIHCLVNVIPADKLPMLQDKNNDYLQKFKIVGERASSMGILQVVLMTRVDIICPLTKKDLHNVYKSKKIKDKIQDCSKFLGVPVNCIFPVCNYHEQTDIREEINCLMLHALECMVQWTYKSTVKKNNTLES